MRASPWMVARVRALRGVCVALGVAGLLASCHPADPSTDPGAAARPTPEAVERGRVLALMGNCAGCHTERGGAAYAGGAELATPFGLVYAGNLTPDPETGLGRWGADDFWRALHLGRSLDGRALVPAFPYSAYTHVSREDSDALYAYLQSLPPVRQANRAHALRFPYGTGLALRAWQWLNFEPADTRAEAAARERMGPTLARGVYLVQGLGHCGACHAPRNAFGAAAADPSGGLMPMADWYAPTLHPTAGQAPSTADTVSLLQTGQNAHAAALGPMAVVVLQSTQHWPVSDLQAVAEYLASLPPAPPPAAAEPAPADVLDTGRRLYADRCADCHGARGEGVPGVYPALAGNPGVAYPTALNMAQVLRHGGFPPSTAGQPRPYGMPPQRLSNAQAAAVLSFIRQSFGHQASAVSELDVLHWN